MDERPGGWMRVSATIDSITAGLGHIVSWLAVVMVLVGALNAVARYLGRFVGRNLSSNTYLELQWYLFSLIFLLGAAYALQRDAHVRVDVIFARFSARVRSWINIFGTVFLLMPFCVFVLWFSWPAVRNSWQVREVSPNPGGLPVYPLKAVIMVCFILLLLQAVSELIKEIRNLRTPVSATYADHHVEGV
jgi:TRAP-type mannitol/chloroaromatic compound transport system permease small subunit